MKPEKKYRWHKIAVAFSELSFGKNDLAEIEVGEKKICIAKKGEVIRACAATCPHAGGVMSEGFLDNNGNIVCPIHRYVFSLENGRDVSGEGYFLKIYPVKIDDKGVFIGIEEGGFFSWLK